VVCFEPLPEQAYCEYDTCIKVQRACGEEAEQIKKRFYKIVKTVLCSRLNNLLLYSPTDGSGTEKR
jgi:hypothetical protein